MKTQSCKLPDCRALSVGENSGEDRVTEKTGRSRVWRGQGGKRQRREGEGEKELERREGKERKRGGARGEGAKEGAGSGTCRSVESDGSEDRGESAGEERADTQVRGGRGDEACRRQPRHQPCRRQRGVTCMPMLPRGPAGCQLEERRQLKANCAADTAMFVECERFAGASRCLAGTRQGLRLGVSGSGVWALGAGYLFWDRRVWRWHSGSTIRPVSFLAAKYTPVAARSAPPCFASSSSSSSYRKKEKSEGISAEEEQPN